MSSKYKKVALKLINDYKGKVITKNDFAKICGFESARDVSNISQLKQTINNFIGLDGYELTTLKGIGFKVISKRIETTYQNGNLKTKKNADAFDQECRNTKRSIPPNKPPYLEERPDDTDLNITIKKEHQRPLTLVDIMNVVEKDHSLIGPMNAVLKPLGKQVKILVEIVDL